MEFPGKASAVALLLGLGLAPLPGLAPSQASAQEAQPSAVGVTLAPVVLAEPEVETPLEINVGPETQVPKQSYVRVRGLPLAARLSEGHVITPGAWAIPLAGLKALKVMAPISASGRTEITVSVLSVDGVVLAEAKSSLVVAPAWLLGSAASRGRDGARPAPGETAAPVASALSVSPTAPVTMATPAPAPRATPPAPPPMPAPVAAAPAPAAPPAKAPAPAVVASLPPASAPVAPPPAIQPSIAANLAPPAANGAPPQAAAPRMLTPGEAERAGRLLFQGDNYRNQGNIAAARQFYRRAADMGLALAAMRLAATYDANELAQLNVQGGIDPDAAEARKWYERAKELGSVEADARLSRLGPAQKK